MISKYVNRYIYDERDFYGYDTDCGKNSALYRAAAKWSQPSAQAQYDARLDAAVAKRTAFLGAAAAIPLFPEIYAGWLVDYLKSGGTVNKTEQRFPAVDPWSSPTYEEDAIWMITNPQTKSIDVPTSDSLSQLKLFVGYNQDRFRNQLALMTTGETRPVAKPKRIGRKPSVSEAVLQSNDRVTKNFGKVAIFMAATTMTDLRGNDQYVPPYTNQPAVYLYSDVDEIVRNLTASDRVFQQQLDQIDVFGSNRAVTE